MRIWKCPTPDCTVSRRAPEKLAANDARRFCFPCSESTGFLVELIKPAVEAQKAERAAARKARRELQRQREAEREARRLATWPGLLDRRHARWKHAEPITGAIRKSINDQSTIPKRYAQLVRLTMPRTIVGTTRATFLRSIGASDLIPMLTSDANRDREDGFRELWARTMAKSFDWLIEDTTITDPELQAGILLAARTANLYRVDDVLVLNNLITNALELQRIRENPHDQPHA